MTIPEYLRDEPRLQPITTLSFLLRFVLQLAFLLLLALLTIPFWLLYWLAVLVWGWPPNVPRRWQIARYLRLTWTVQPPPPDLQLRNRLWLTLTIVQKVLWIPVNGLAWLLDEILYGKALDAIPMHDPLIEISAARSGSTQIARYIEEDPSLAAPSVLQAFFPYLWLWRIVPYTIGRFFTPDQVRKKLHAMMPPEFIERHEADPFKTDTFDVVLYGAHLNMYSFSLGPKVIEEDFGFAVLSPHNQPLWEEDFVDMLDRIGRKTLHYAGPTASGHPHRLFVKGHFLVAADALSRRFPDATFLTVIRHPAPRLQSAINYMRVNPVNPIMGHVPWTWLAESLLRTESDYCKLEYEWYRQNSPTKRCVVRFVDFVNDLEGTMSEVYRTCLGIDVLPAYVPRTHPPRERQKYLVNRSLAELGISEAELNKQLGFYIDWCQ